MRKLIYLVILVVLLCASNLSAGWLAAANYYVDDSNGNDNWDGTSPVYVSGSIGPFKTISKGIQCADSGGTVIVADGTYYGEENIQFQFYDDAVTLKSSNGPDKCILNFYGDDYPWVLNNNINILIGGFTIRGVQYGSIRIGEQNKVVFDNCDFENNILSGDNSLITCCEQGSLKLNNCAFSDNIVSQGSIVKTFSSANLEISNCLFTENIGTDDYSVISCAGNNAIISNTKIDNNWNYSVYNIWGLYFSNEINAEVINCDITNNLSEHNASGIVCEDAANVVISGCNISANISRKNNHGIFVRSCGTANIEIEQCIINNNGMDSSYDSAAILVEDCNHVEVLSCLIANNLHGAIEIRSSVETPHIKNCTIVNNMNSDYGWGISSYNHLISVDNCIIKNNGNEQIDGKEIIVSYSDVSDDSDHIWPGVGNINADPLFVDPNSGDYHLLSQAGRWDSANQRWVRDDVSSPCIDGGDPADWVGDEPAGNGGRINMGYFGGTSEASKADFCTGSLPGDINHDCFVNFIDFALMTSDWLGSTIERP